ncbi:hypothetical protein HY385_02455 [Candidatus Daviesbacteria bacterium]|nr:hypothetical protein [Candidatus Daviesbacteria bacterium]
MRGRFFILVCTTILLVASFLPFQALADEVSDKLAQIQSQIAELQSQLDAARGQEKTLKSQLTYIDTQAKLTELKMDETNTQIAKLEKEITDLSGRITRLSATVDSITQVLLTRIVQTYKYGNYSTVDLLFSSNGFSDLLVRMKYIQVAQANDKKVLYQLQATKAAYHDQKKDKETRQVEQAKLKKDLEKYQGQLVDQKKSKEELLKITQNNEAIYQQKIITAQQEQNAILAILNGQGNEVTEGPVSKGQVVGNMISGRSACSSGTHLHFEVHQGGIADPNNYLSNTSFTYDDNDGGKSEGAISPHGSWDWPLLPTIYITQGYGMTPYAQAGAYNGGPHTGIDMYSSAGLAVRAVRDGTLARGGIACGGGTLNYKKVNHDDGTSSYYLHVL